jgi:hypothetical protein
MAVLLLRSILRKMTGVDGVSCSFVFYCKPIMSGLISGLLLFVLLRRRALICIDCWSVAAVMRFIICAVDTPWRCCCCEASCAK